MNVIESILYSPWYVGVVFAATVIAAVRQVRAARTTEVLYPLLISTLLMAVLPLGWAAILHGAHGGDGVSAVWESWWIGALIGVVFGAGLGVSGSALAAMRRRTNRRPEGERA
ncbi:hypothetical protein [Streptomyces sp. NPDC051662]|uniref:hypothetical protein n=1 Tax=Streptomyces sp. NPDC051662 TaxID=3154750 RepID=UPI0034425C71